jgi:hypothetical protein
MLNFFSLSLISPSSSGHSIPEHSRKVLLCMDIYFVEWGNPSQLPNANKLLNTSGTVCGCVSLPRSHLSGRLPLRSLSNTHSVQSFCFFYEFKWKPEVVSLGASNSVSVASFPLFAPTWARTRDPLNTSTTVTLEASSPIGPQKPWPLQSKG